jgi:aminoglycoside 3-N-acetyltransferase
MKPTAGAPVKRFDSTVAAAARSARRIKQRLAPIYSAGRRLVAQTLFSYTPEALEQAIRRLDIAVGDTILVHSGYRRTSGFRGNPGEVVDCLLRAVGTDGNLLMMSMPYRGSSQRYIETNPLFDVVRSPSAVGVISEVFRRRDNVLRSLSPLHPVLACGPLAAWFVADHDKTPWSCGKGSPFDRFLQVGGKFLFFDAPYSSMTFMHFVEDAFREQLPVPLYDATPALVRARDGAGRDLQVRQFFFSQEARQRRYFRPIEEQLTRDGRLKARRVGNTRLLSVSASAVVECASGLVASGRGFYR